jgi:hypothetical protein
MASTMLEPEELELEPVLGPQSELVPVLVPMLVLVLVLVLVLELA